MNARIKGLVTVASLLVAAACSDASLLAPDGASPAKKPGGSLPMTWSVEQSYSVPAAEWAAGGVGAIDFGGSMTTPTPCYDVTATNEVGRSIVVTVSAAPTGDACIQVITYHNYTGRLTGMLPGEYDLVVRHLSGGGKSTVAYNGWVVVQ